MGDELTDLREKVIAFTATVTEWMSSTTEYRQHLCKKVDAINEKLSNLPCKERKSWYGAMDKQIRILWGFVVAIVLAIIVEWIKGR